MTKKWREANNGALPKTGDQKTEFKKMIKGMNKFQGDNFKEAIANSKEVWRPEQPFWMNGLLSNKYVEEGKTAFWGYLWALKQFREKYQRLPVTGIIPDMISTTESYLSLQ